LPMLQLGIEGERTLLKALLEYEELRCRIDEIDPSYLSEESRKIFEVISDNREMDSTRLCVQIYNKIGNQKFYDGDFITEVGANYLIDDYKELVGKNGLQRLCLEISKKLKKGDMKVDEAMEKFYAFQKESSSAFNYISIKEANELQKKAHTDIWNNRGNRLHWPFKFFEDILNGLRGKELVVVAGETGTGKTAFMLNAAALWASFGKTVGYISLEIDVVDLKDRMHQKDFAVNLSAESEKLDGQERERLLREIDKTGEQRLFFCDSGVRSVHSIIAGIKLMHHIHRFDVVFIDYLQLMTCPGKQTKDMEIGEIMGSLKALAMEIRVPIIVGSQLNREVGKNDKGIPRLSNLRESGTIEHSADVVILLYRPILYDRNASPDEYQAIVAKQRSGRTGTLYMHFDMKRQIMQGVVPGERAYAR